MGLVMLVDRRTERSALDSLLACARGGLGCALVLRGEPGVGKTALLEYAIESASGFRIARAGGVESEMELAFAALHQLCAPLLDRLERLPDPQRAALGVAFGLRVGAAPDRFLVGLAMLSLLSEVAGERPLLCVVDDAQWLDRASAQALAFAARRLLAEPVAVIFGTREPAGEFTGLPEQVVQGLADTDARALLGAFLRVPLDERVCDRIVAETRGNPLALLELPRGLTPEQLAGGFGVLTAPGLPGRIEESFLRRYEALPPAARRLLLVAAAEPAGDPVLVWRAAGQLGISPDAAAAVEAEGLLSIRARVTFRHPLVRSALYEAASEQEQRAVHRALAEATDPQADPDRRAWHLAQAAPGPDEEIADELERSADRAQARGGVAAAAAFLERAVALTLDPARQADRALAAANAKFQVGAVDPALGLLAIAEAGPLDERHRARADLLRGRIAFLSGRMVESPLLLLKAARQFESLDLGMARETYLDALGAALYTGRLAVGGGVREVADAARWAPASPHPERAPDLLLDGLALLITEGYTAGVPVLKQALQAFRGGRMSNAEGMRWLWLVCHAAIIAWDWETWRLLSARQVSLARDAGAVVALPVALVTLATLLAWTGDFAAAAAMIGEAEEINEATGNPLHFQPFAALQLAWQGDEVKATALIERSLPTARRRGEGLALASLDWAAAVLYNGLGRYQEALAAAERASEHPQELWSTQILPELIEAAVRSGQAARAAEALDRLTETTRAAGTDWALGTEARSRALLAPSQAAEDLHREAIDSLGRSGMRFELARAHLLYGEWLRRQRRRGDARDQLRAAYDIFASAGAGAFAERARIELRGTGEHVPKRTAQTRDAALTAREAHIARLAGQGASNAEIAAQLFISPATVAYHLRKVFATFGISSRSQLASALPAPPD